MSTEEKHTPLNPLDNYDWSIPEDGHHEEDRRRLMSVYTEFISEQKSRFLGYQANQQMAYGEDTKQFLNCHINNVGDPYVGGNFTVNSKHMERAVLDYYARLWHARIPKDRENPEPEDYWGYALTMGSTEGNIYGLWNARDYLAGRKLIVDKAQQKNGPRRQKYLKPLMIAGKPAEENPNARTPVAFFSQDTHYSIVKAMRVLGISTFYDVGTTPDKEGKPRYKNPLEPDGSWEGYEEVPSRDGGLGPGSIDIEKLRILVSFFAEKGYPILINLNYGSTFKGAYDDVEEVTNEIIPVLKTHGLYQREIQWGPDPKDTDRRNGFWIHVDGALGASYMPFLAMAKEKNPKELEDVDIPKFDFQLDGIHSIVMSGHKWPGAPWPCGLFMTKVGFQLTPPDDPEYLGSPDSTFAGSRNGFTPVILWNYLATHSREKQTDLALECETIAAYAYKALQKVREVHPDFFVERTPLALTVRFKKPNDKIIFKYSLSCESLNVDITDEKGETRQEVRHYAHLFAMMSTTRKTIDNLVDDLMDKEAFSRVTVESVAQELGRGWR